MKAAFYDRISRVTYIINNDKVYKLNSELVIVAGPLELRKVFPGIESADAVYKRTDGRIVFFKDTK